MRDNIIEFPTSYIPSNTEYDRLWSWQMAIIGWRKQLVHEQDMAGLNTYNRVISRQKFHDGVRRQWKVYLGFSGSHLVKLLAN